MGIIYNKKLYLLFSQFSMYKHIPKDKKNVVLCIRIAFPTISGSEFIYTKYENTIDDTMMMIIGIMKREKTHHSDSLRYFLINENISKL